MVGFIADLSGYVDAGHIQHRYRACGPFAHAILAGTAGAVALPFAILLLTRRRMLGLLGIAAIVGVVVSSNSSGPIMSVAAAAFAFSLWWFRFYLPKIRILLLLMLIAMHIVSTRGVWYLMARIDIVGGSTGYHRAKLIDRALADIGNWWLAGTDYTRHWMWTGVSWSPMRSDITIYYLNLAVVGGLPLAGCLIAMLVVSFRLIGKSLSYTAPNGRVLMKRRKGRHACSETEVGRDFAVWCVGSAIFTHAVTFVSISYFDQNYVFFYMALGMIPGFVAAQKLAKKRARRQVAMVDQRHPAQVGGLRGTPHMARGTQG